MATGVQSIKFNNGTVGDLTLTVARAGTAYQEDGTAKSSNVARYASSHRIAAAPTEPIELDGFTAASFRPLSSGFDSDGSTPILVVRKGIAELHVHVRSDPEAYYNTVSASGSYVTTPGTSGDLLLDQTSDSGGTAEIANHEFVPGSAAIWKGYVVVGCDHLFDDGGGFDSVGCALAYTTVDRLEDGTNPWILLAVTEEVNLGVGAHHQAWSLTKFEVSATLCVFLWTDYGTGDREGGNCQMSVLDISSGSPVWTHVRLADSYRSGSDDDEHFHSAGLIIDGDGDWHVLISVGDGYERNRLIHRRLAASDVTSKNWGAGTSYSHGTYGATGISASFVIENPHANWGSATAVWGDIAASAGRAYRHNQVINLVQADSDCSALLCGTDETCPAVIKMTWDDSLSCPVWTAPYIPSLTSVVADGVVNFVISGKPDGPFVAKIGGDGWDDAGTGGSGEADLEACVIYSPDGESWTQIIDWQQAAQYAAVLHAGKVYLGTSAAGTASYITLPTSVSRRPLQIASSAANLLNTGISASTPAGVTSGVTITDLASLPAGVPNPPCGDLGPGVIVNVTGGLSASRQSYGNWDIASLTNSFADLGVRLWVYALPFDGSTYNNRASASMYAQIQNVPSGVTFSAGNKIFGVGGWVPFDIWCTKTQLDPGSALGNPWTLRMRLRADSLSSNTTPCQFILLWEHINLDAGLIASNGGVAAGGSALSEVCTVTGVDKRASWSLYAECEVPWDQWDNRTGGGTPGSANEAGGSISSSDKPALFKLDDTAGADEVVVYARPDSFEVELDVNGSTTASSGNDRYWRRGDSFNCVITCDGAETIMYFESTDGTIKSVTVADAMQFDQIVSGDPILWHRFIVKDGVDSDPEETLRSMAGNGEWSELGSVVPRSAIGMAIGVGL